MQKTLEEATASTDTPVQPERLMALGGKIALLKAGRGATPVILLPGIGDTKERYASLLPMLAAEATLYVPDSRGFGESSVQFDSFGVTDVATDTVRLIEEIDLNDAIIVGNSGMAASAVYVAAELPGRIRGIVLTGPFLRDQPTGWLSLFLMKQLFRRPWGPSLWAAYYKSLHKSVLPDDLSGHAAYLKSTLKSKARLTALGQMLFSSKKECELRIPEVKARVAVVMGTADPDFKDPIAEARWAADVLKGELYTMDGVGHYPHRERPAELAGVIRTML
jgi:pimeloyl-ACP methyl ester carboxylesterase